MWNSDGAPVEGLRVGHAWPCGIGVVRSSAADDAGLPADPAFRTALRAYMQWAVADVLTYSPQGASVPTGVAMPHWSWDGLQTAF